MRAVLAGAAFLLAAVVLYFGYRAGRVFWSQYRDFHPNAQVIAVPQRGDAVSPAVMSLTLADGTVVRGWWLPSSNGAAVVFLHGSPGDRRSLLPLAETLQRAGYGAVLLDLPGHGESGGAARWDEDTLQAVRGALAFALGQPGVGQVAIVGYSMGSAIAARVAAAEPRVRATVLLAPFTDLAEQLRYQFRHRFAMISEFAVLGARASGVPVDRMRSLEAMDALAGRPVMIVAGDADGAIPVAMPRALYAAAKEPKRLWIIEGAGHNNAREIAGGPVFDERIRAFLDEALRAR